MSAQPEYTIEMLPKALRIGADAIHEENGQVTPVRTYHDHTPQGIQGGSVQQCVSPAAHTELSL